MSVLRRNRGLHFLQLLVWYFFALVFVTVATQIRKARQGHLGGNVEKKIKQMEMPMQMMVTEGLRVLTGTVLVKSINSECSFIAR